MRAAVPWLTHSTSHLVILIMVTLESCQLPLVTVVGAAEFHKDSDAAAGVYGHQGGSAIASLGPNIPGGGVPGRDYPTLASVPYTGFSCTFPGYFADTADEARCQVFHICQYDGRRDSFLCPNGTIFNQAHCSCDWWYNVQCGALEKPLVNSHFQVTHDRNPNQIHSVRDDSQFDNGIPHFDDEEVNSVDLTSSVFNSDIKQLTKPSVSDIYSTLKSNIHHATQPPQIVDNFSTFHQDFQLTPEPQPKLFRSLQPPRIDFNPTLQPDTYQVIQPPASNMYPQTQQNIHNTIQSPPTSSYISTPSDEHTTPSSVSGIYQSPQPPAARFFYTTPSCCRGIQDLGIHDISHSIQDSHPKPPHQAFHPIKHSPETSRKNPHHVIQPNNIHTTSHHTSDSLVQNHQHRTIQPDIHCTSQIHHTPNTQQNIHTFSTPQQHIHHTSQPSQDHQHHTIQQDIQSPSHHNPDPLHHDNHLVSQPNIHSASHRINHTPHLQAHTTTDPHITHSDSHSGKIHIGEQVGHRTGQPAVLNTHSAYHPLPDIDQTLFREDFVGRSKTRHVSSPRNFETSHHETGFALGTTSIPVFNPRLAKAGIAQTSDFHTHIQSFSSNYNTEATVKSGRFVRQNSVHGAVSGVLPVPVNSTNNPESQIKPPTLRTSRLDDIKTVVSIRNKEEINTLDHTPETTTETIHTTNSVLKLLTSHPATNPSHQNRQENPTRIIRVISPSRIHSSGGSIRRHDSDAKQLVSFHSSTPDPTPSSTNSTKQSVTTPSSIPSTSPSPVRNSSIIFTNSSHTAPRSRESEPETQSESPALLQTAIMNQSKPEPEQII